MLFIKECSSWLIILILIILTITNINIKVTSVLFALFYVLIYLLGTNRFLSLFGITVLGIIFDSVNHIVLGFSSTILIATTILYFLLKKNNNSFSVVIYYSLSILNLLFIIIYTKLMLVYFNFQFINLFTFIFTGIISIIILYPIILITNRIIYNAK